MTGIALQMHQAHTREVTQQHQLFVEKKLRAFSQRPGLVTLVDVVVAEATFQLRRVSSSSWVINGLS